MFRLFVVMVQEPSGDQWPYISLDSFEHAASLGLPDEAELTRITIELSKHEYQVFSIIFNDPYFGAQSELMRMFLALFIQAGWDMRDSICQRTTDKIGMIP